MKNTASIKHAADKALSKRRFMLLIAIVSTLLAVAFGLAVVKVMPDDVGSQSAAQSSYFDEDIAALVNGKPILMRDVEYAATFLNSTSERALYKLIDEELVIQEAERLELAFSDEEMDNLILELDKEVKGLGEILSAPKEESDEQGFASSDEVGGMFLGLGSMSQNSLAVFIDELQKMTVSERAWLREGVRRFMSFDRVRHNISAERQGDDALETESPTAQAPGEAFDKQAYLLEARDREDIQILNIPAKTGRKSPLLLAMERVPDEFEYEYNPDRDVVYDFDIENTIADMSMLRLLAGQYFDENKTYRNFHLCVGSPDAESCGEKIATEVIYIKTKIQERGNYFTQIHSATDRFCMTAFIRKDLNLCMDSQGDIEIHAATSCSPAMQCIKAR